MDTIKTSFNSFVDSKFVNIKMQTKLLAAVAILTLPIVVFMFVFVSPKKKEVQGLSKTKTSLEQEIGKAKAVAARLDEHKDEMASTEKDFENASLLLPQKKEIPSLLTNISGQGTSSGLDILSFKPQTERMQDFYAEIPVSISVKGPYHNVGVFLDKVSKLERIVTAENISMGTPTQEAGEMYLSTKLSLVTYRFIEPGETADKNAQAAGNKKKSRRRR